MTPIAINPSPRMSRYLVEETTLLQEDPLIFIDVGARGGYNIEWKVFGDCLRVYCFEADEKECAKLNASAERNIAYLPVALGKRNGPARLYEARLPASTGLYP